MLNLKAGLSGEMGEIYVLEKLYREGYIASTTPRGTKGVDILCTNTNYDKFVAIEVKNIQEFSRKWPVKYSKSFQNLFYVFVCLNKDKSTRDYFIVPSEIVVEVIEILSKTLKRNGKPYKGGKLRKMPKFIFINPKGRFYNDRYGDRYSEETYRNNWDLLGLK